MLYKFQGHLPTATHQPWDGWVAPTATVIGQVELGRQVSVWFGAVVRAENSKIKLGDFSNVQENAVLHTDAGIEMSIGNYVTEGKVIPDNSVVMGSPGKVVKTLDEDSIQKLTMSAMHYAEHFQKFQDLEEVQL